jgi:hypothetical protein
MENKAASASRAASKHRLTDRDFAARAPKPSVASFSEIPRNVGARGGADMRAFFRKLAGSPRFRRGLPVVAPLGKNLGLNVNYLTRAMDTGNYAACG